MPHLTKQWLSRAPSGAGRVALTIVTWAIAIMALVPDAASAAGPLPVVELEAGPHLIHAELANTYDARLLGLMFRESLAPNHGMLFIFDEDDTHCMWMRNTPLPLSVAFIDSHGAIVNIEEMKARTDDPHCAKHGVHIALEMAAGWYKSHGLAAGSVIKGIDKAAGTH